MDIDTLNIPAFKRKRSLAAKARKRPTTPQRIPAAKTSQVMTQRNIPIPEQAPEDNFTLRSTKTKEIIEMQTCGSCDGYFDKINVAVIKVVSPIRAGDTLLFETTNGLFQQTINSMQQNRKEIKLARSGSEIGVKVAIEPKVGGNIYKII